MITLKETISILNRIIYRNKHVASAITYKNKLQPSYSDFSPNVPLICKMRLTVCNDFYRKFDDHEENKVCPFCFNVKKTYKELSNLEDSVRIYTIVKNYKNSSSVKEYRNSIGRRQKKEFDEAVSELENFPINESDSNKSHDLLVRTLETLLLGRISSSMQGLVHQIFTPLQGSMSDVKNLLEIKSSDKDESFFRLEKNLQSINGIAQQIQMLLSTVSEFTPNMIRKVVVHDVVNRIIDRIKPKAEEKFIDLNNGFNKYTKAVEAIPYQFEIVIDNIIENAVKYSFSGFKDYRLPVYINYHEQGDNLVIEVINIGVEITETEISERLIFDLGYRGEDSQDRQRKGTGIGLFIANRIINAHRGNISVSCQKMPGSKTDHSAKYKSIFRISIPYFYEE